MTETIFTLRGDTSLEILEKQVKEMVLLGIKIFRFNFAKQRDIQERKEVSNKISRLKLLYPSIELMLDFPYPKTKSRINMPVSSLKISEGNIYKILRRQDNFSEPKDNLILLDSFVECQKINKIIYYGDGECAFEILEEHDNELIVRALTDYKLCNGKALTAGYVNIGQAYLYEIKSIIEDIKPEFVAFSFISSKDDICFIKEKLTVSQSFIFISKIENATALSNLVEIIENSDAVMIARGDLGLYTEIEKLYFYQNEIIIKSKQMGKKVYVATGILTSLVYNYMPSRADINDLTQLLYQKINGLILNNNIVYHKKIKLAVEIINKIDGYIEKELQ